LRLSAGGVDIAVPAAFVAGDASIASIEVPVAGGYPCVELKDVGHSLTTTFSLAVVGTRYEASVALRQGDSNDDDLCDMVDFAIFIDAVGAAAAGGPSNFNDDLLVNNADFSFLAVYGMQSGDACGSFDGGAPQDRISIRELRRRGLGHLAVADLNGDGWVDFDDVAIYLRDGIPRGHRPTLSGPETVQ
ncbi:MAG: hypothetical protein ACKO0W_12560, partial [Planctomycetota bacterium]